MLAIVAIAVVSSGCGGGSALALDPVAAAATKTQQAGAAHIRFVLQLSGPRLNGGKVVRIQGTGAVDGTSAELTTNMGSILQQAGLDAGTNASTREIVLEQNGDYVLYIQPGALASQLPTGKHWIELNVSKLGKAAGIDLGQLMSGSQISPADLLSMLKAEGAKIHKLGPTTVGGTAATHYRVTVDLAKALQAQGLTNPMLDLMAAKAPTVPVDVWIGHDGLVHRLHVSYGAEQSRMGLTMDMYDYGAHVTIAAPPSSDVYDATQLAQQGMSGTAHW